MYFDEETERLLREEYGYDVRAIYKTVWEIKQRHLVQMAADRGAFIDQSQSFNVHIGDPNFGKLTSLHFTAWRMGLKTGMYYLRTRAAADAIKFTVCTATRLLLAPAPCSSALLDPLSLAGGPASAIQGQGKTWCWQGERASDKPQGQHGQGQVNNKQVGPNTSSSNLIENLSISSSTDVDMQKEAQMAAMVCSLENKDACLMCGS
jgi:ribonucleoside-diphosphate reductase subunit M1